MSISAACTRALLITLLVAAELGAAPAMNEGEQLRDGPYVTQQADGRWRAQWVGGTLAAPTVRGETVAPGGHPFGRKHVIVPGVGAMPEFTVRLRSPSATKKRIPPDEVSLAPDAPLFVIADTHGQYEIAATLLQRHGIIGAKMEWSFGKGHLAILGDVFDRGPHQTELLWLFYKLEAEAERAGGAVHLLLGNHETLVLLGSRQDLHPKYPQAAKALSAATYADLWSEHSLLGQWLRTKPAVQKIGGHLVMHGGISREVINRNYTLRQLNYTVRDVLDNTPAYAGPKARYAFNDLLLLSKRRDATEADRERAGFVTLGELGPLWYRGYFADVAKEMDFPIATSADIDAILAHFGATDILVGHTIVPTVTGLYEGRVIAVQVYPRRDEKTGEPIMEGVLINDNQRYRAKIDGTTEQLVPEARPTLRDPS